MEKLGGIIAVGILIFFIVFLYGIMFGLVEFPSGGEEEYCQPGQPGICY